MTTDRSWLLRFLSALARPRPRAPARVDVERLAPALAAPLIRIAPALRSYRSRLGFWAWTGAIFLVFGALGFWGDTGGHAPSLSSVSWPGGALLALVLFAAAGWLEAEGRRTHPFLVAGLAA